MRRRLVAMAAAGLALAGAAVAAPPAPPPAYHPPRLFLSPSGEPFRAGPDAPDPLQTWFDQADTGHLGYLDRAEFRADAQRFFKRLDANGDGRVDGFEVAAYEQKIVPELADWSEGIPVSDTGSRPVGHHRHDGDRRGGDRRGPGRDAGGDGGGHGPRSPALAQLIADPEPVMAADYDFDSHITPAEWMRLTDARFDALDETHAGKLTLAGLRARLASRMQPGPAPRQVPHAPERPDGQQPDGHQPDGQQPDGQQPDGQGGPQPAPI